MPFLSNVDAFIRRRQQFKCLDRCFLPRVALLDAEDQHIGINEDRHSSVSLINTFPG